MMVLDSGRTLTVRISVSVDPRFQIAALVSEQTGARASGAEELPRPSAAGKFQVASLGGRRARDGQEDCCEGQIPLTVLEKTGDLHRSGPRPKLAKAGSRSL